MYNYDNTVWSTRPAVCNTMGSNLRRRVFFISSWSRQAGGQGPTKIPRDIKQRSTLFNMFSRRLISRARRSVTSRGGSSTLPSFRVNQGRMNRATPSRQPSRQGQRSSRSRVMNYLLRSLTNTTKFTSGTPRPRNAGARRSRGGSHQRRHRRINNGSVRNPSTKKQRRRHRRMRRRQRKRPRRRVQQRGHSGLKGITLSKPARHNRRTSKGRHSHRTPARHFPYERMFRQIGGLIRHFQVCLIREWCHPIYYTQSSGSVPACKPSPSTGHYSSQGQMQATNQILATTSSQRSYGYLQCIFNVHYGTSHTHSGICHEESVF